MPIAQNGDGYSNVRMIGADGQAFGSEAAPSASYGARRNYPALTNAGIGNGPEVVIPNTAGTTDFNFRVSGAFNGATVKVQERDIDSAGTWVDMVNPDGSAITWLTNAGTARLSKPLGLPAGSYRAVVTGGTSPVLNAVFAGL